MKKLLHKIDNYGQEIKLTIDGKSKRTSKIGGTATLFVIVTLLAYGTHLFTKIITEPFEWEIVH